MTDSDTLVKALAEALPKIANPSKDGQSHHGKYSTLPGLLDHVKPILAEHGLAVTQRAVYEDGLVGCETLFLHVNGESITWGRLLLPAGQGPQQAGAALTYARRYGLLAAVGVSGDDDDAASTQKSYEPTQTQQTAPRQISDRQIKAIHTGFSAMNVTDRAAKLEFVANVTGRDVASSKDLTSKEANQVISQQKKGRGGDDDG